MLAPAMSWVLLPVVGAGDVVGAGAGDDAGDVVGAVAGVDAGDVVGGALGGLPRREQVALGVSAAIAAGWQLSQWCLSTKSEPSACLPVMTSSTDLPTLHSMGKGPC